MQDVTTVLILLAALAAMALLALILVARAWQRERSRAQARIEELLRGQEKSLSEARRQSVEKSRSSLKGQIAEQMAPLLPGFPYRPAEARFIGDPLDYVVFNGYSGVRDGGGGEIEVVLLEVKQGGSALSTGQRAIARSVEEGRVRFEICRIAEDGKLSREIWRPRG
jgi:predicted Holliday junction resolvase-like endonuclease